MMIDIAQLICYNSNYSVAGLCNGSTYGSDPYCLGSNPSPAAIMLPWSSGQDVALSRRRLGFDSPWGYQINTRLNAWYFYVCILIRIVIMQDDNTA